ncbi:NAD(+)/NADH kinase [uncultured Rikenella sp.]|uniref:NAD(+)/NADH kinase n=1 Tax=uncultured Rikenella sp. TaxID=368003 RepID=UPI0026258EC6|nr:NAD(+)/NADH kinase [uncultured Rikenella sp.]
MKIALYSRPEHPSLPIITGELRRRRLDFTFNPASPVGYDLALSFGGDGTFLSTVRKMGESHIPILGINSGRLGFMAAVALEDLVKALDELRDGSYTIEERTLLAISGGIQGLAVNEFTIQKDGTAMISVEIGIDGEQVATYWADGAIVSTSTGSTAYSMSVGGAILAPGCRCLILSPIAPHNLNIRPLVVPDTSRITLKVTTRNGGKAIATIDNRERPVADGTAFELAKAGHNLRVVRPAGNSFYKTLRNKLLWGVDARNNN